MQSKGNFFLSALPCEERRLPDTQHKFETSNISRLRSCDERNREATMNVRSNLMDRGKHQAERRLDVKQPTALRTSKSPQSEVNDP